MLALRGLFSFRVSHIPIKLKELLNQEFEQKSSVGKSYANFLFQNGL